MAQRVRFNVWYLVALFAGILIFQAVWQQSRHVEAIPYSKFQQLLKSGEVQEITVAPNLIRGKLRKPDAQGRRDFVTVRVDDAFARELSQYDVKFSGVMESTWLRDLLSWIIVGLVFIGVWMYVIRRAAERQGMGGGGLFSIGRSKAKIYVETDTKVSFDDVAGVDEAKEELREVVAFLKSPRSYGRLGARVPKGVLLIGPPGTGKTLLARAVAGEAAVPFFSINGSEFVEMFVGVGAARVRDLFEQARSKAPAIVFIDELDALGRARGAFPTGGHDEKEQTLNQLLSEMDGFDTSRGLVVIAATNRPEILDPALLRAGRFDRQVLVDRPDKTGRIQILKVHLKKVHLAPEVEPEQIANLTPGFSGADLANLVNEAALLATRRDAAAVTLEDFTAAVERIVAGLEKKNRLLNPHEREVVAHHEMGHALLAMSLPGVDPVHKISIIPRGMGSLGYTIQRPTEERFLMTREELENRMCVLLGGRAAERLVFDHLSTGAADDLAKVTDIARSMVMRYGMREELGHVAYLEERSPLQEPFTGGPSKREFSEETAREIDRAVREMVAKVYDRAMAILKRNRQLLVESAHNLLDHETLGESELAQIKQKIVGAS